MHKRIAQLPTSLSFGPKNCSEDIALAEPNLSRAMFALLVSLAEEVTDGFDDFEWLQDILSYSLYNIWMTYLSIVSISYDDCLAGFFGPLNEEKKSSGSSVKL